MKIKPCTCGNSEKFKEHQIRWFNIDSDGKRIESEDIITKFYCSICLEEINIEGENIGKN